MGQTMTQATTAETHPSEPERHEAPSVGDARLRAFIERIERLEEDKANVAEDIRQVYGEAKAFGYDPKIMRQVVRLRKMDASDRSTQEALLDSYLSAVGE